MKASKITSAERIALLITLLFFVFTLGVFVGRATKKSPVVVEAATPAQSVYTYSDDSETDKADSQLGSYNDSETSAISSEAPSSENVVWSPDVGILLDINAATIEDLQELPGIGPVLAQAIVDYRSLNGPFASVEELINVEGIGEKTIEKIIQYITIGE